MQNHLKINKLKYSCMIGTGGIGTGTFFTLRGNHTLGREESRGGHFLDRKDYCKLHIVSHYMKVLLGSDFEVITVGRVGNDREGKELIREMKDVGLNTDCTEMADGEKTLFSFCFIYPDGSGGNLTTDNSASSRVTPVYLKKVEKYFKKYRENGIAVALPEVPVETREKLLDMGEKYRFFRVASFTTEEMEMVRRFGILKKVDFLSVNREEAFKAAGIPVDLREKSLETCIHTLSEINPNLMLIITAGKEGSWSWNGKQINHIPSIKIRVVSSAGAGDAFLAGVLCGLAADLSVGEAQELGNLVGGMSVTSPHTINKEINRKSLLNFAENEKIDIPDRVRLILQE